GREVEVLRSVLPVAPLADQPDAIAFSRLAAIVGGGHDAPEGEPGAQRLAGTLTPRVATEVVVGDELLREIAGSDGLTASTGSGVDYPDPGRRADRDGEVEAQAATTATEFGGGPVGFIRDHGTTREIGVDGTAQHVERELRLGLEDDLVRDPGFRAPCVVVGPRLRQVELEIDREMRLWRGEREADANLAVGDLAGSAGVLALDPTEWVPFLSKPV